MTNPTSYATRIGAAPPRGQAERIGRLDAVGYLICLGGIVRRELLRFFHQKERFFSALVRPLVWLFIFAAGFRNTLGVSIEPPYQTYVLYEVYVVPGLAVMIQLFNGMQSSLSMVYDREVGSMKVLLTSPYPRWTLLLAKLVAGVSVSIVYVTDPLSPSPTRPLRRLPPVARRRTTVPGR